MTAENVLKHWQRLTQVLAARAAHTHLAQLVVGYVGFGQEFAVPLRKRVLPNVTPVLLIDFGPAVRGLFHPDGAGWTTSAMASPVTGLLDAPVDIELTGRHLGVGVVLTPPGAFALFGVPMSELTNQRHSLTDVLGAAEAERIAGQLASLHGWPERFDRVERLLAELVATGPTPSPAVLAAWHRLQATAGQVPIARLADEVGLSKRRLQMLFGEQVGVTPKSAARILRFRKALRLITDPSRTHSLASVAVACGFSDQAHLSREVRALAGVPPRHLRPEPGRPPAPGGGRAPAPRGVLPAA
ncbi:helix-turn-helix domain-containing protein [Streptomyces sp. SCA3-4]|uniref:helix-turn-helix domain-containing protein n=1 Tax=Streptomyces sichuanensis TaxID=2871810 RepID=UPI001CE36AC5|nr:helix-turn-helix domain-containing protein [Streptomyces sichuanensis]MCA6096350.1 helix-turn-helix domain-containing protein [Streptomyces sichuanensis]